MNFIDPDRSSRFSLEVDPKAGIVLELRVDGKIKYLARSQQVVRGDQISDLYCDLLNFNH